MAMKERTPSFATADGTEVAAYADFLPRLGSYLLDWMFCFWIPLLVMGIILLFLEPVRNASGQLPEGRADAAAVGRVVAAVLLVTAVVTYFLYFTVHGQSRGMKMVGIRIVNQKTGRPPGLARAIVRSFLALVVAAFTFYVAVWRESNGVPKGDYSSSIQYSILTNPILHWVAAFVLLAGVFGYLWAIWDPKKQTLLDKVAGVVVVAQSRSL